MSTLLGYSSELYYIDPKDIASLKDAKSHESSKNEDIIILISPNQQDCLISGRKTIEQAIRDDISAIPVRIVFKPTIPSWNLAAIFIKPLRQKYKYNSSNVYHMNLNKLKELKIERGFRNTENAYKISKRWNISEEQRIARYEKLCSSLQNGYDDNYPIDIMLCRRAGVKDCIDDGHHRIGVCAEYGIDRIAVRFRAAGRLPRFIQKILLFFF